MSCSIRTFAAKACGSGISASELQIAALFSHDKSLPRAVRADGFNRYCLGHQSRAGLSAQPEAWRYTVLEHFEAHDAGSGNDFTQLVVILMIKPSVRLSVAVAMAVTMPAAAQEPGARDVYGQAETGNRNRLGEVDRHRHEDPADRTHSR